MKCVALLVVKLFRIFPDFNSLSGGKKEEDKEKKSGILFSPVCPDFSGNNNDFPSPLDPASGVMW